MKKGRSRKIEMHWVCSACGNRNLGRHKECQRCGDPKDAREKWIMPTDPSAAPTVHDPELLRHANAGADWQCAYCGSHQRRLDGRCQQCGAAQAEGATVQESPESSRPSIRKPSAQRSRMPVWVILLAVSGGGLGLLMVTCVMIAAFVDPPPDRKPEMLLAEISSARWTHRVQIERYRTVTEEGFLETRPGDAFEITSLGDRHHHDEQVLDHYRTEHYTEQVPYQDTETYTASEQCGEDCRTEPERCSERCTTDNNGFATCTEYCSGGGQSCSPRYCSVTRTRSVTRYRSEPRTREVPVFRSEPRYQEFFQWRAWRWGNERIVETEGSDQTPLRWPNDDELAPSSPLGEGERERFESRSAQYRIELQDQRGMAHAYQPTTPEAFEEARSSPAWVISTQPSGFRLVKPRSRRN